MNSYFIIRILKSKQQERHNDIIIKPLNLPVDLPTSKTADNSSIYPIIS